MKFMIIPRNVLQSIENKITEPHVVISYLTPDNNYSPVKFSKSCLAHTEFHVDDVEDSDMVRGGWDFSPPYTIFTEKDAKRLVAFVDKWKSEVEIIICQCDAGISRSSATAAALSYIMNGNDMWVFQSPRYHPNMTIYKHILNTHYNEHPE